MSFEDDHLSRVNVSRIDALEKRMNGLDVELKETNRLLHRTREELSALKTEMRIWGAIIMAGILGMLGLMFAILRFLLEHVISSGGLP